MADITNVTTFPEPFDAISPVTVTQFESVRLVNSLDIKTVCAEWWWLGEYEQGNYRIAGSVSLRQETQSSPLRRRVMLIPQDRLVAVRETWSDAQTGLYSFDNIRGGTRYTVVASDHEGLLNVVVADNLEPEPMP